jgi:hypothetical protein
MGTDTPNGVPGDVSRDGGDTPSRAVIEQVIDQSFFTRERMIPSAYGALMTPVVIYWSGEGTFNVTFGSSTSAAFDIWTDDRGLEAMITSLQAALVRAQIAREAMGLPATPSREVAWLSEGVIDPADIPF